ncbi:MAG: hypothetical protein BWY82_00692 [Verrucomicrobia bacterium ADurb.Bin474]|nr:MAG: hypothetical protein BWY82_00692 [Verrucomicrobia bacterium ADurb.Bin474]
MGGQHPFHPAAQLVFHSDLGLSRKLIVFTLVGWDSTPFHPAMYTRLGGRLGSHTQTCSGSLFCISDRLGFHLGDSIPDLVGILSSPGNWSASIMGHSVHRQLDTRPPLRQSIAGLETQLRLSRPDRALCLIRIHGGRRRMPDRGLGRFSRSCVQSLPQTNASGRSTASHAVCRQAPTRNAPQTLFSRMAEQ